MATPFFFFFLLLLPLTTSSPSPTTPYTPPTVPELLDEFRLPHGLLPPTAHRYLLHQDGTFELYLDDSCGVVAGGYHVHYNIKITGKVEPGSVTELKGVYVRAFFFVWVGITGVEVDGGVVTVSAGPVKKSFPADGFTASPRCRGPAVATSEA